jgi:hypothetical protein
MTGLMTVLWSRAASVALKQLSVAELLHCNMIYCEMRAHP